MTAILGLRGTGQFDTDARPKNYRELFTLLEPNGTAPLQALLAMSASESTNDPEFKNFRDELPNRTLTVNQVGGHAPVDTTLNIDDDDDEAFLVAGSLLKNLSTGEVMRVTAANDGANTVDVVRGIGGAAAAIADGEELIIMGFADQEGGLSPEATSFDAVINFNYTQIFKTAIQVTGTLQNTYLRTGDKEQEAITKALKLHMADIERSMFFGNKDEVNGATASPTRYTGGLFSEIVNQTDLATDPFGSGANTMSENDFDQLLIENIFAFGSAEKVVFAGPRAITNLQRIAKSRWQPTQVSGSYGVSMTRYSTYAGDLLVHLHPMFRQISGLADTMVVLDFPYLKYRYMANRDTKIERNIQANDFDGVKHQYLTECGLEMTHSKVHHIVENWDAIS
jgi:hypothetical protein